MSITVDVVFVLPPKVRSTAVSVSRKLATLMDRAGHGAAFRLGEPYPGRGGGPCEPHVSLFMMAVDEADVPDVAEALARLTPHLTAVAAIGLEYRYNREGAPELFYERSDEWRRVQRAIVADVEPLRKGRLREFGPGGERLSEILAYVNPADPARVRQLERYGYDDVSDDADDRLNPHVTLAWPNDVDSRVDLSALPQVAEFDCQLVDLALYRMSPHGTCTQPYGRWVLGGDGRDR